MLNASFTIGPPARYTTAMLMLALFAATAAAQAPAPPATSAVRQATASVRIVAGARISAAETPAAAIVTQSEVRDENGRRRTVRLVEFP